jgi:VWFA-related protein
MKPALFTLALSAGLAVAQSGTQSGAPAVIRSNTRLVQVNVVVHDKNGAVADLKQEDFVVFDGRKQRKIASFAVETATSTIPGAMPKLQPNVFVNSLQRHSETPTSVTAILFDTLNTPVTDQRYARNQVAKFLGTLQPEDGVALYSLSRSSIQILHDFTDDPRDLARIIKRYRGVADGTPEAGPIFQRPGSNTVQREAPSATGEKFDQEKFDQMVDNMTQTVAHAEMTARVRLTTQALESIANHLAPLPGRKNLVWISASFPFSVGLHGPDGLANPVSNPHEIYRDDIARTARALNQANMAIYPVDARGLMVTQAYQASLSLIFGTGASLNELTSWVAAINGAQDTMEELASRTGGKAFYNTNDIGGSVRRAIEDTKVSYVLGFYPEEADIDGKYHELRVQVPGRKGLELRARQGYYAGDKAPVPDAALQTALQQAVAGPLQSSRIEIGVHVTRTNQLEPNSLQLDLLVSARELTLALKEDRWQGALRQSIVQLDAHGKVLERITDPIKLNLKRESLPEYLQTGMSFAKTVRAKPGLAQLRVIVMDRDSGVTGSVIIPMSQVQ